MPSKQQPPGGHRKDAGEETRAIRAALGRQLDEARAATNAGLPPRDQRASERSAWRPNLLGRIKPPAGRPPNDENAAERNLRIVSRELDVVPADSLAYKQAAHRFQRRNRYRLLMKMPEISKRGSEVRRAKAAKARSAKETAQRRALDKDVVRLKGFAILSKLTEVLDDKDRSEILKERLGIEESRAWEYVKQFKKYSRKYPPR